jgi:hypothetical protein
MARQLGQIIARGQSTWLVRVYLGRDLEAVVAHDSLHACGPALRSLATRWWKPNLSSPAEGVDLPRQPRRFTVVDVDRSTGSSPRLQDISMKFVSLRVHHRHVSDRSHMQFSRGCSLCRVSVRYR